MKLLPDYARTLRSFVKASTLGAALYFLIQVIFKLEEFVWGGLKVLDLTDILAKSLSVHLTSLVFWIAIFLWLVNRQRRSVVAARERQEQFEQILENAVDGIYLVDANGNLTFANRAAEQMLGLTRARIFQCKFNDAAWKITTVDGSPVPDPDQPFSMVMRTGQPVYNVEQSLLRADGRGLIVSINAAPLRDSEGAIVGVVGAMMDITARRRVEQALRQSEEQFRSIFEAASDAIVLADSDGNINGWNEGARGMFQYTASEVIGKPVTRLMPERYHSSHKRGIIRSRDSVLAHRSASTKELWGLRKDGTEFPLEIAICAWDGRGGKAYGAIIRDISERKRVVEELGQSEARHRAFLEAIPDSIYHIREDGVLLDYKPPADRPSILPSNDRIGKRIDELLPPDISQIYMHQLRETLNTRKLQRFEFQPIVKQAVEHREGRMVPGIADDVFLISRDITERVKVEQLKNEFVSIVSHELRTPLTSIRGSLGLIAGGITGQLPAQAKSLVDIAYKNSERLVRLVNDILDIEKIESGKMVFHNHPLRVATLLEQAIEANSAYAQHFGVRFVLKDDSQGAQVNANADRLMQVMTNLLSNAVKYSPPGGRVEVTSTRSDAGVRISVRDFGPGIPKEFQKWIFQKFAQADLSNTRQKSGSGLGLNISKAIVEKLGGQIGFETEANVGTTFFFDLPEWHSPVNLLDNPNLGQARVLVCEDDRDTANLLRLLLAQSGYESDLAYSAAEARQMLSENQYVGMTLDLVLPDECGLSLIQELREQESTRNLPIVVVSIKAEQGRDEVSGDAMQVVDWLSKPIDPARLLAALARTVPHDADHKARILHVDDDADILEVARVILQDVAEVCAAQTLTQAMQKLQQDRFDLVILDLEMPDGSGMELLSFLNERRPRMPVVIFSIEEVKNDTAAKVAATLVKSRTSNERLVETISSLIHLPAPVPMGRLPIF